MSIFNMVLSLMFQGVFPCYMGLGANPTAGAFKNLAGTEATTAGQYGSNASAEGAQLNPFFSSEMKARHGFDPTQTNEMLTAAEAGAGGATGGATGLLMNNAARTGNATGVTKSLDEMARDRSKAAAGASEGIAAQDVLGAKQLNQQGAQGMQGLYGTNTSAQLSAMKDENAALQGEQAAIGPGWLQKSISDLSELSKGAGSAMSGAGAMGASF